MKKKNLFILAVAIFLVAGAFWAKNYYNNRYMISDSYYTQIPEDEINEDSWLVDSDGVRQVKGKEYTLMGYNDQGKEREVYFTKTGSAEDYYAPGTYIKVDVSKTLVVGLEVVDEVSVPQAALEKINMLGTKIK